MTEPLAWTAPPEAPTTGDILMCDKCAHQYYFFFAAADDEGWVMGTDAEGMTYPLVPIAVTELPLGTECGLCHDPLPKESQDQ